MYTGIPGHNLALEPNDDVVRCYTREIRLRAKVLPIVLRLHDSAAKKG